MVTAFLYSAYNNGNNIYSLLQIYDTLREKVEENYNYDGNKNNSNSSSHVLLTLLITLHMLLHLINYFQSLLNNIIHITQRQKPRLDSQFIF